MVVCAWLRFRYGGFDRIAPGALTSLVLDPVTEVIGRPGVAISEYNPPSPLDIALKLEADESTRAERLGDDALVAPVARPGEAEAEMAAEAAAIGADAVPRKPFLRSGMASACVAVVRCSCCSALMSSSMCVCVCVCVYVCVQVWRVSCSTTGHDGACKLAPKAAAPDVRRSQGGAGCARLLRVRTPSRHVAARLFFSLTGGCFTCDACRMVVRACVAWLATSHLDEVKAEEERKRQRKLAAQLAKKQVALAEAEAAAAAAKAAEEAGVDSNAAPRSPKRKAKGSKRKKKSKKEKDAATLVREAAAAQFDLVDEVPPKYHRLPRHHSMAVLLPFVDDERQVTRDEEAEPTRDPVIPDQATVLQDMEREAKEREALAAQAKAKADRRRRQYVPPKGGYSRASVDAFLVKTDEEVSAELAGEQGDDDNNKEAASSDGFTKPVLPPRPRSAPLGLFPPFEVAPERAHVPVHPVPVHIRRCPRYGSCGRGTR